MRAGVSFFWYYVREFLDQMNSWIGKTFLEENALQ